MDALLNRWDASRRIKRDKLYKDLDEPRLLNLLSRLAAGYFEENIYFFREEDLHRQIGNFLVDQFGEEARTKGALVLQDIEQHYGLIVRRSQYAFSFSHLTFMEYFTAQYVVDKALGGSVNGLIESHFREDRWLEVFVLTAGKLGHGADEFLLKLQRKNREIIREVPELETLLQAIQAAILPRDSNYSKEGREAMGVVLALGRTRNVTQKRVRKQAQNQHLNFKLQLAGYLARSLALHIDHTLGHTLDFDKYLDLDLVNLNAYRRQANIFNTQIISKISSYLEGNIWIVKCLNSGATVSAKAREHVLAGLFRPEGA
jgi:hypothetical protein